MVPSSKKKKKKKEGHVFSTSEICQSFLPSPGLGVVKPSPDACPTMSRSLSNTARHPETRHLLLIQILLYDPNPNARF